MTLDEFMAAAKALGFDGSATLDEVTAKLKGEPAEEEPAADPAADPAAAAAPAAAPVAAVAEEEKKPEEMAARMRVLFGKPTLSENIREAERCRALAGEAEKTKAEALAITAAAEMADLKRAVVEVLYPLGVETPATSGLGNGKLCQRLIDEGADAVRARGAALLAARGGKLPTGPRAPGGDADHGLTEYELAMCKRRSIDPAKYAASPARMHAVNKTAGS